MFVSRIAVLALVLAAAPAAAVTYTVVPIALPGGATIAVSGLGEDGSVVGQSTGTLLPVIRRPDGSIEDVPTLGGSRGSVGGINAAGAIVGGSRAGANGASNRPFLRPAGGTVAALPLPAGGTTGFARDINDAGAVVGSYSDSNFREQPFRWTVGTGTVTLARPAGFDSASAVALNAAGVATGLAYDLASSAQTAVRWAADGSVTSLAGTRDTSQGNGINNAGTIVGGSRSDPAPGAFVGVMSGTVWLADGTVIDAGIFGDDFGSDLGDIDNFGVAYGTSFKLDQFGFQFATRLVRWTLVGGLQEVTVDFGSEGLRAFIVGGVNDAGQIVLQGFEDDGDMRSVLLTPAVAAVPEPASWALMIAGFAAAGVSMRRRTAAQSATPAA